MSIKLIYNLKTPIETIKVASTYNKDWIPAIFICVNDMYDKHADKYIVGMAPKSHFCVDGYILKPSVFRRLIQENKFLTVI